MDGRAARGLAHGCGQVVSTRRTSLYVRSVCDSSGAAPPVVACYSYRTVVQFLLTHSSFPAAASTLHQTKAHAAAASGTARATTRGRTAKSFSAPGETVVAPGGHTRGPTVVRVQRNDGAMVTSIIVACRWIGRTGRGSPGGRSGAGNMDRENIRGGMGVCTRESIARGGSMEKER